MLIVSQNGLGVLCFEKFCGLIYENNQLLACIDDEKDFYLGYFKDENFARQVLADFVKAYSKGEDYFKIPAEEDAIKTG